MIAYIAYCYLMYQSFVAWGQAESVSRFYPLGAALTFSVFAIIVTLGVFRWARKKFPGKEKRNRSA